MSALGTDIFASTRTLKPGVSGEDVRDLQSILRVMFEPELGIAFASGIYNSDTTKFVTHFQKRARIAVDGAFGPESRRTLLKVWNTATGVGSLNAAAIVGNLGPAVLQRLRSAGGSPVAAPAPVVVPGRVVAADGAPPSAPIIPTDVEPPGFWAMFKAPVKLPFIDVRVPRWTLWGGGAVLLGGVVSAFGRRK